MISVRMFSGSSDFPTANNMHKKLCPLIQPEGEKKHIVIEQI